jgi:hypothetical protein
VPPDVGAQPGELSPADSPGPHELLRYRIPPLTASATNSAPDFLAGLASGVNNAVARVAGLLWIAALPPITGLTGAAYTDPMQFRSSFAQIRICAAAFACAAVLAATFITGPGRPPRHQGLRSFKLRCPTSPARSPSATHRDKPRRPNSRQAARKLDERPV